MPLRVCAGMETLRQFWSFFNLPGNHLRSRPCRQFSQVRRSSDFLSGATILRSSLRYGDPQTFLRYDDPQIFSHVRGSSDLLSGTVILRSCRVACCIFLSLLHCSDMIATSRQTTSQRQAVPGSFSHTSLNLACKKGAVSHCDLQVSRPKLATGAKCVSLHRSRPSGLCRRKSMQSITCPQG